MNSKLLGARIRQARERLGLSQEDLAASVAKDQAAISEYENGKRKLSAVDLPLFAKALNESVLFFFGGEVRMDDLDRAVLDLFQQLPTTESKHTALEILEAFCDAIRLHHTG